MYRPEDAGRIQFHLRGANWSDFAAVATALKNIADPSIGSAWTAAGVAVASGGQLREFGAEVLAPAAWVEAVENTRIGSAVWRDASWGNNAAPSWQLGDSDAVLAEAFYYTVDNGERFSEHIERGSPYVSVVIFDEDRNPTVAFESSPDDFLTILRTANNFAEPPAEALRTAAEGAEQDRRIFRSTAT